MQNRKSTRLKGFDYSSEAAYFITIVTKNRQKSLGKINGGTVVLSDLGKIVQEEWLRTEEIRTNVIIDQLVIMPDHLHSIVIVGNPLIPFGNQASMKQLHGTKVAKFESPSGTIGAIVRGFKAASATKIKIAGYSDFGWHRNYHDHIIRNQQALSNIQNYISNNPDNWKFDEYDWESEDDTRYFLN